MQRAKMAPGTAPVLMVPARKILVSIIKLFPASELGGVGKRGKVERWVRCMGTKCTAASRMEA